MATILTKRSNTAASVPLAAQLTNSTLGAELAVNTADKRLFTKDGSGNVVELGTNPSSLAVAGNATVTGTLGVTGVATLAANPTLSAGTANGVAYLNGSKVLTSGSALTFDGSGFAIGNSAAANTRITVRTAAQTDAAFAADNGVNTGFRIQFAANLTSIGNDFNNPLAFLQNNTEAMRLTSTGLGIGTSSPTGSGRVLQIYDSNIAEMRLTNATSGITSGDGLTFQINAANGYIWNYEAGFLSLGTSGAERLRLDSAGNLGLGVVPSASTIAQFEGGSNLLLVGRGNAYLSNNATFNSGFKYINTAAAGQYNISGGTHLWLTAPSGTAGNAISFTQAMTLDSSGRLAVGATDPSNTGVATGVTQLYVVSPNSNTGAAATFVADSVGRGLVVADQAKTTVGYINVSSSLVSIGALSNTALLLTTNATERARIDSSGNLLVAKTSLNDAVVGFSVTGSTSQQGAITSTLSGSTSGNTTLQVYSTGASAYRFYVNMAGTVFATNTTISAISDRRFKENIVDLDAGLDAVLALKPRKFDWKTGKGKDIKGDRGFIAQEFEQVFPDLIDEWKDPAPEGEEPYKSVRADLIPVLVKAIQEQQAQIAALTARLNALDGTSNA